jgi:hypothetical protein
MAKQAARTELSSSSSELNEETSSSEDQQERAANVENKRESIKNYVTNVLHRHERDDEQPTDLTRSEIKIETTPGVHRRYENVSAFRQYHSNAEGTARTDAQQRQHNDESTSDEDRISTGGQVKKILI